MENVINSDKIIGIWLCVECGRAINNGYSYRGRCVVCAEKYLNPDYNDNDN